MSNQNDPSHPQLAMMIRKAKEQAPLAASLCWDGGTPEVERRFDRVFSGLILGIRPEGTTIADISRRFIRYGLHDPGGAFSADGCRDDTSPIEMSRANLALAKLKSDFVSNVSHELRTPLALIRLYAETLELGRISTAGKHQQYYEIIRKESERLTSLINNILDFSASRRARRSTAFAKPTWPTWCGARSNPIVLRLSRTGFSSNRRSITICRR